jgi:ribosome modulation factor
MGKKAKISESFRHGWKAASDGQSRSSNPYPYSSLDDRDEWFRGYDEYLREASAH